jgi:hypothetical protein
MWLINARTFTIEEVWNESVKEYAILSHRWEDDEVSFQNIQNLDTASCMKGFTKIKNSCEQALKDGYGYVWVDTCCINKESTAELAEAINSMYRWYQTSGICYVFLSDVQTNASNGEIVWQQVRSSIWFTRGWTLQELLAPQSVVFYNQNWEFLGTKQTLARLLTLRTGIDERILNGEPLYRRSVAQRMSWASARTTTRVEDIAYCLLGIFEVNMPMLYGEGERAFLRLQEEIIKRSDDHSIFAWPMQREKQSGLLANDPTAFANCQFVRVMTSRRGRSSYALTNRGLSVKLMATPYVTDTYIVRLDCADGLTDGRPAEDFRHGIFLRRLNDDDQYARVMHVGESIMQMESTYWDTTSSGVRKVSRSVSYPIQQVEFNVPQRVSGFDEMAGKDRVNGFCIATQALFQHSTRTQDLFRVQADYWDQENQILSMKPGRCGILGTIFFDKQDYIIQYIRLGFDFEYNPVCFIGTDVTRISSKLQHNFIQDCHVNVANPFENMHWSTEKDGAAMQVRGESSLWALRGDRLTGIDVRIGDLGKLKIARGEFQDKVIWDVILNALKCTCVVEFV